MFREDTLILEISDHEQNVMIDALSDYRSSKLSESESTDSIDALLIKTIKAPTRREKRRLDRGETP